MPNIPIYPPVAPEKNKTPLKVDKPGVMATNKQIRFRPLRADRRGRRHKWKDDPRYRVFY